MKKICTSILAAVVLTLSLHPPTSAQGRGANILFGDVKVEEGGVDGLKPISVEIALYNLSGYVLARQVVGNNGRYRFINLSDGEYDLVVSMENSEVTRLRVQVRSPAFPTDIRQDITLEWKSPGKTSGKPGAVGVADYYERSEANQKRFDQARAALDKKSYEEALALLNQLVSSDASDFQAWTELGTVYFVKNQAPEAEKAYLHAIEVRPRFFQALWNLGRLRSAAKNYEGAITPLSVALEVQPTSASVNYSLGEAYLQIKKGSKAVGYLSEALRLEPIKMADAHLRLAALYNGAGMKTKAAAEYEQFLKKKPDYPDRKKLEQYIAANKQP